MDTELINKLYKLLEEMPITSTNRDQIRHIKDLLDEKDFEAAMAELQNLKSDSLVNTNDNLAKSEISKNSETNQTETSVDEETNNVSSEEQVYPKELLDDELEETYMGLLLSDPKSISRYFFLFEDCYFANNTMLTIYKMVLFADGEAYASENAKRHFNFAKDIEGIFPIKEALKLKVRSKKYDFEKIYVELRKLFILRKNYLRIPIKGIQQKIVDIINYRLYSQMSIEEVESAVNQAEVTSKFKQAVLNTNVIDFLTSRK